MRAAEILALTGLDLITDVEFLAAAKSEFLERTAVNLDQSLCQSDILPLAAEHVHHIDTHDAIHHL